MLPLVLGALIAVQPQSLHLQIGGLTFGKVTASASKPIGLATSTCFTIGGSPRDILRVTALKSTDSEPLRTLTIEVKAQHPGTCQINFKSEANSRAVEVIVKPEEP